VRRAIVQDPQRSVRARLLNPVVETRLVPLGEDLRLARREISSHRERRFRKVDAVLVLGLARHGTRTIQRLIVVRMERASWDEYFMSIAQVVATRSTCPRKFVGAVLVRNRTILSTGYNGSIRGMPHCADVGHMMEDNHCVATIHAEANAIIQAAKNG